MNYEYPWIPDGEPLELRGTVAGARADLVKGELTITLKVPVTPYTLSLRDRLRVMVDMPMSVAVDIQALRMTMEKLADLRSQPAAPGQDRQYALGDVLAGEVLEEVAERVNAGELGPNVTAQVGGLDGPPPAAGPEPLPTLLEAQVKEAAAIAQRLGAVSPTLIERKMRISWARALQVYMELQKRGMVNEVGRPTDALIGGPEADATESIPTRLEEAIELVKNDPAVGTISGLQRKLGITYHGAVEILEELRKRGLVADAAD